MTGAGISTESGIPDFRSPRTGLWNQYDPMQILSTTVLFHKPKTFYGVGFPILVRFRDALPNAAHQVLAEWEQKGVVEAIVTQNIDSLHTRAGSKRILEIHGHLRSATCMKCKMVYSIEDIEKKIRANQIPPRCHCSGVIRPDVVLFGDMLPACFEEAMDLARRLPLLVIGSSLQVSPANFIPSSAKKMMIINLESTPFDNKASMVLTGKAGVILTAINEAMNKKADNIK